MKKILVLLVSLHIYAEDIKFNSSKLPLFSGMTEEEIIKEKKEEKANNNLNGIKNQKELKDSKKKENIEKNELKLFVNKSNKKELEKESILDKIEKKSYQINTKSIIEEGQTFKELKEKEEREKKAYKKQEEKKKKIRKEKFNYKVIYEKEEIENILDSFEIYVTNRGNYYIKYANMNREYLEKLYTNSKEIKIKKYRAYEKASMVNIYIKIDDKWTKNEKTNEELPIICEFGEEINFGEDKFTLVYY